MMKNLKLCLAILMVLLLGVASGFAEGKKEDEKTKVTYYWALYDGLIEQYRLSLQDAFNTEQAEIEVEIVPIDWGALHDKLTTSIAGGNPPEISVIGTRWLLELLDMDAVEEVTQYLSKSTVDNIAPGAMEAKIEGKLMGLPVAAGSRFLALNTDHTTFVPKTMEELRAECIRVHNSPNVYAITMPGKKHTELTDFAYYLLAAGGYFFEAKPDGSWGKSAINSPKGVKALSFMVKLAEEDKVAQDGYMSMDRGEGHDVFYAGKVAYTFIGAWVESSLKQVGATFKTKYVQIPGFEGHASTPLIITDSVAMFKNTNLEAAGKFLDFFYQDEWKAKFDELIGFPPVTISAGKLPQFQTPMYQTMAEANLNSKGWPLIVEWPEVSDITYDAVVKAFLKQMSPKEALDEAAAKIDKLRGM